jgi:hypothetical protein
MSHNSMRDETRTDTKTTSTMSGLHTPETAMPTGSPAASRPARHETAITPTYAPRQPMSSAVRAPAAADPDPASGQLEQEKQMDREVPMRLRGGCGCCGAFWGACRAFQAYLNLSFHQPKARNRQLRRRASGQMATACGHSERPHAAAARG